MGWSQCRICQRFYNNKIFKTCGIGDCQGYSGPTNDPLAVASTRPAAEGRIERVATATVTAARDAAPVVSPRPVTPPRPPVLARRSVSPVPVIQKVDAVKPAAKALCFCCYCEEEKGILTPCCRKFVCNECKDSLASLFDLDVPGKARCQHCKEPIDPNSYTGQVNPAILQQVRQRVEAGKKSSLFSGSSLAGAELVWAGNFSCPQCHESRFGFDEGCDVMKCPTCGVQFNVAKASAKKSDLSHSGQLSSFYSDLRRLSAQSSDRGFDALKNTSPDGWRFLHMDELISRFQRDPQGTAALLLDERLAGLKAYLFRRYGK